MISAGFLITSSCINELDGLDNVFGSKGSDNNAANYKTNFALSLFHRIMLQIKPLNAEVFPEASARLPHVYDHKFKVELVSKGLNLPTSMAFLDKDNILITQKNDGKVRLISNGVLQANPVLQLKNVNDSALSGLLGIAIDSSGLSASSTNKNAILNEIHAINFTRHDSNSNDRRAAFVFLYVTENTNGTNNNDNNNKVGSKEARNAIYRFEWDGTNLYNPVLILSLPTGPDFYHSGGKLLVDPDNKDLYASIGDTGRRGLFENYYNDGGTSSNIYTSHNNTASSIIVRINYDGRPVHDNPFISVANYITQAYGYTQISNYLIKCFAYGIRNSFGMTLDPVTKNLWMSDNGPDSYDEVNVVQHNGFNGGWAKVSGPISRSNISATDLVNIQGSNYSDPIFSWQRTVAPTGLDFAVNSKAFNKYNNSLFVGDFNHGDLYNFKLNPNRDGFVLRSSKLQDNVADTGDSLKKIIFATGFEDITDVKMGPDGFLYVLTYSGNLFRVISK